LPFFRSAFRVIGDATSLGGTARIRYWTEKQRELLNIYQRIRALIHSENEDLQLAVKDLKDDIHRATKLLRKIRRILDPLGEGEKQLHSASSLQAKGSPGSALALNGSSADSLPKEMAITAAGMTVGAGTAAAGWGAVQVLAHASTGTAMAAIHGAAAANAGWAWFGGGSLAVGGGGMALGHLVLPGIGTAVAVTFSSVVSHREANRLADLCAEIEKTNATNQQTLTTLQSESARVRGWESRLENGYEVLSRAEKAARTKLFRLGFLSYLWRIIKTWFGGDFYNASELDVVKELDSALVGFIESFRTL
jgi:hypothetical protein